MTRVMMVLVLAALGATAAHADGQSPKAQCKLFKKTSDGRWYSTIDSKVGNPKEFKVLKAGMPIDPALTIVGLNVSATIDKLCGAN
jgi:hypothetical protein